MPFSLKRNSFSYFAFRNCVFFLFLIFFLHTACKSTKELPTLKPENVINPNELVYDNPHSFIHIPVHINLKDIETYTNAIYEEEIYVDDTFEDDQVKMTVWKEKPIQISNKNGKINTVLPLKAKVFYRIGTNKFGFDLYDTREFNLNATITLLSDVGLSNWEMKTNTHLVSIQWHQEPSIRVLGKEVPITNVINPALGLFQEVIEKSLDQTIEDAMDFKPQVLDALEQLCNPFQMSETYESWLRVVPVELYTTDAVLENESVHFTMGMKSIMETIVGNEPKPKFDRTSIKLKPVKHIPSTVAVNIIAISSYEDASRLMTQNFKNEEFGSGNRKVKVKKVSLWQNENKLLIALDIIGSVNGTLYLSGFPQYNAITQEVYFDQLDYVLDSKSVLAQTANWLASNTILLQLQERCRYSIKPNLEEGKENILSYIENYSPVDGVFINGQLDKIAFQNIQLTHDSIVAFIKINGNISITVDGI